MMALLNIANYVVIIVPITQVYSVFNRHKEAWLTPHRIYMFILALVNCSIYFL